MHFERIGTGGTPLIMLHGFGATLESLKPLALLLGEKREVWLVDLPGFGKTLFNEKLIGAEEIGNAVHVLLKERGLSEVDLLGHSFGGKVAMLMASRHPDLVRKLVLIAPSGLKRKRNAQEYVRHHGIKWLGKFLKLFKPKTFETWFTPKFASSDYKHFPHVRKILVRSINENIDQKILQIKRPSLLLWGARDSETPLEMGQRLNRMIKGSHIIVYPTLGHRPFQDVGRHLIKEHVDRFLEETCC